MLDGVVALGITIAMLRLLRRAPRPVATREPATARFRVVLRDRRHIGFYLLIFVEGGFTLGAFAYFGAMLHDRDGFSYTTIGVIISLFGMASIVAGRLLGRFARRLGERRMILFGGLGTAASYALVVVQPAAVFAPLAMLLLGVAWIVMHSTLQTRATELAPGARHRGCAVRIRALPGQQRRRARRRAGDRPRGLRRHDAGDRDRDRRIHRRRHRRDRPLVAARYAGCRFCCIISVACELMPPSVAGIARAIRARLGAHSTAPTHPH
jgi:hypothetical protein